MGAQLLFQLLPEFGLERWPIGAGQVEHEATRFVVTPADRHHHFNTIAAALRCHDASELQPLRKSLDHIPTD